MPRERPFRKLAAHFGLILLLVVYSLLVMVFATSTLPSVGGLTSFLFYAVAGMAWVPLAILILKWGYRPSKTSDGDTAG
mgnify:CR=1 FL=1